MVHDIYEWLDTAEVPKPSLKTLIGLIEEETQEFIEALERQDYDEMLNAVVDLKWVVSNLAYYHEIPAKDLMEEHERVLKSNYSKFCKTKEEAIETCNAYKTGTHPNKLGEKIECTFRHSEISDLWIVTRLDGKILKSINYCPPEKF